MVGTLVMQSREGVRIHLMQRRRLRREGQEHQHVPGFYPLLPAQGEESGWPCYYGGCRCGFGHRLFQPEHAIGDN